jgi:hypothetical protein
VAFPSIQYTVRSMSPTILYGVRSCKKEGHG